MLNLKPNIKALLIACLLTTLGCVTQANETTTATHEKNYLKGWLIEANYAQQIPLGRLAKRFSSFSAPGVGAHYYAKNWQIGVEANYHFGARAKNDTALLLALLDENGYLISTQGYEEKYSLEIRGMMCRFQLGKAILFDKEKGEGGGIMLKLGLGYWQHRIHVKTTSNYLPQINKTYQKGYDRFTAGFATSWFVGYQRLKANGFLNFYAGAEINLGFSKMQRNWQFDLNAAQNAELKKPGTDCSLGLKAGWYIPVLNKEKDTKRYYRY